MATVVLAVTTPVTVLLVAAWASGATITSVQSGSMEPQVPKGAAAVIRPVDAGDVDVGTVIAFRDPRNPNRTVIHRVRDVRDERGGRFFQTQGDANATPDPALVPARMVEGRLSTRVLGLGSAVDWLADGAHAVALAGVAVGALGANEAVGAWRRRRARRRADEVGRLRRRVAELEEALAAATDEDGRDARHVDPEVPAMVR